MDDRTRKDPVTNLGICIFTLLEKDIKNTLTQTTNSETKFNLGNSKQTLTDGNFLCL